MSLTTPTISPAALEVLRGCAVDANLVRLPAGQLDRALYEEVNEVLVRLGGKWQGGKIQAHRFTAPAQTALLAGVVETGLMPPKNPLAFFPTPERVIREMEGYLGYGYADRLSFLEPSAGRGALAQYIRSHWVNATLQCVECDPLNAHLLLQQGFAVHEGDFLAYQPSRRFDVVLMNPPFAVAGQPDYYVTHIQQAFELLEEWGTLVAVAPASCKSSERAAVVKFRELVNNGGGMIDLPAGSFKESGTGVNCVLVVLSKDEQVSSRQKEQLRQPAPPPAALEHAASGDARPKLQELVQEMNALERQSRRLMRQINRNMTSLFDDGTANPLVQHPLDFS